MALHSSRHWPSPSALALTMGGLLTMGSLAGCGTVVIEAPPGGETTTGGGGGPVTTSTPDGGEGGIGGGGGDTGTTTVPVDECDGIQATGGEPLLAEEDIELLLPAMVPHFLRSNETGVFFADFDIEGHETILRVDKATAAATLVTGEVGSLREMTLAGDSVIALAEFPLCPLCPAWGPILHTIPASGGTPEPFGDIDDYFAYELAPAKGGVYTREAQKEQLLFVPFGGGAPTVVIDEIVGTDLTRGKSTVYFLSAFQGELVGYDEESGAVTTLWTDDDQMRAFRERGGPVHWLSGYYEDSRLRRLAGGAAQTLLCSTHGAYDLALNDTHAFVATFTDHAFDDAPALRVAIWRVPLAGGPPDLLVDQPGITDIEVDEQHLYWLTGDRYAPSQGLHRIALPR